MSDFYKLVEDSIRPSVRAKRDDLLRNQPEPPDPKVTILQLQIHGLLLEYGPLTVFEIAERADLRTKQVQYRINALKAAGMVKKSGKRGKQIVWRAAEESIRENDMHSEPVC